MKRRTFISLMSVMAAAGVLTLAGCSSNSGSSAAASGAASSAASTGAGDQLAAIQANGKLVVALEGAWQPWSYHDESDTLVGYDVEVSRAIAEKLGVTKPSVVRVLNLLMERGMIVKEYYGKIYLTDRGIFVAREVKKQLDEVLAHFPPVEEALTDEERFTAALALTAALPERVFTGRYDQLMGAEEAPPAAG